MIGRLSATCRRSLASLELLLLLATLRAGGVGCATDQAAALRADGGVAPDLAAPDAFVPTPDAAPPPTDGVAETSGAAAGVLGTGPRCAQGDFVCEKERFAFEAIRELHGQLDDDKNGDIDTSESEEFLRNELQYKSVDKRRRDNFHHNDSHITVDDLWQTWCISEVHNWTVDQVALWLSSDVEMPQLVSVFRYHNVDGATLPRLAVNHLNFVSILGIKSVVSRQKLSLKAMDVVLFGPPRRAHSFVKDALLITALAVAIGGIWFARHQYRQSRENLSRWEADLQNLQNLQERLVHEKMEKEHLTANKIEMETKIKAEIEQAKAEAEELRQRRLHTDTELSRLKVTEEELQKVREALANAERELEMHRGGRSASAELQRWLQITYELEQRSYLQKKSAAEAQLALAKAECEKLTRKRNAFLGSLRMAHANSFDELELQIAEARQALEEVKLDFTELQHRWQAIERASGLQVETNPGLAALLAATGHVDPQLEVAAQRQQLRQPSSTSSSPVTTPENGYDDELLGSGSLDVSIESLTDDCTVSPSASEPSGLARVSSGIGAFQLDARRSASAHDLQASTTARPQQSSGSATLSGAVLSSKIPSTDECDAATASLTSGAKLTAAVGSISSSSSNVTGSPADESARKPPRSSLLIGLTKLRGAKAAATKAIKERSGNHS